MKFLTLKITLAVLVLAILGTACTNRNELEELKAQNKQLLDKIDLLEEQIEQFRKEEIRFIPFPTLDKHNVSIGEELNLQVNLAWWYNKHPPTVILKDELTGNYNDTLVFGEYNAHTKSIIANKKGMNLIEGKILFSVNGQPKDQEFQIQYVVE